MRSTSGQSSASAFVMPVLATTPSASCLPFTLCGDVLDHLGKGLIEKRCADQHQYLDPARATHVCNT